MKKIELSLILPCYNEAEHFNTSIKTIVNALKADKIFFEIILVEDASQDTTKELIREFLKKNAKENITALYQVQNEGRGKSVSEGIRAAKGKYVGFMDIDCEVSPKHIPQCLRLLKQDFDVVCGKRQYETTLNGFVRAVASKVYAFLVRSLLHTQLADTEAGYKFFNRLKILPILSTISSAGWFWDTEVMVRSERKGLKIAFLPVQFVRRTDKTSTVRLIPDTIEYAKRLLALRKELRWTL